ncbi:MAG: hypothetical protein HC866_04025 [Leptolyngbyaceae cyanobacterium RU_5_1]|nr:hypothetical protein [Leptolyngbyaceae cyanobacterium RU_5_1]
MKTSFLSEVQNSFRRLFVAARVEKYIRVSNQWLLANSGKVLEHAHRVAQQLRGVELEKYFNTGKEWLLDTPERALTHAYDAALLLKKIEDEHFAGNPVTSISNYSDGVSSYFQLISRKHLILIQVRLLEFKASHVILDVQSFNQDVFENNGEASPILEQLKFIDDVLTRYQAQSSIPANSSDLITGQAIETPELEIHSQPNRQWQLLEALHLNFGKENTSQDAQSIITVESPSPSPQLIPRPISNLVAASMLFTGGLVIGGLSSWLLLSTQNQANEGSKRLNSTEVNPDHAHTETSTPNLTARLSPPETLPPESSLTKLIQVIQVNLI